MILEDTNYIKNHIKNTQRLMGVDSSRNHLGLAVSDVNLTLAFPLKTIKRTTFKQDMLLLKEVIKKEEIFALVVGFPFDGDGSLTRRSQSVKDFSLEVLKYTDIPIFFQDERFSTNVVKMHKLTDKNLIDEQSAAWFLQIFLDKLKISSILV